MRKFKLKNFRIPNPYLEMWKQNAERESNMYGEWRQNEESGIKM